MIKFRKKKVGKNQHVANTELMVRVSFFLKDPDRVGISLIWKERAENMVDQVIGG